MKDSKKYKVLFWVTFALNAVSTALCALSKNLPAVIGWLLVLLWMFRCYRACCALDQSVKLNIDLARRLGIDVNEEGGAK